MAKRFRLQQTFRNGLLVSCLVLWGGCRDEQAGPHGHAKQGASASPNALPAGRVLDQIPQLEYQSGATLGNGALRYLGSRFSPRAATPGQAMAVGHYFVKLKELPAGYRFFTHVVDAATGEMRVNADHEFQRGAMPLERWPQGKVLEDIHSFQVPASASGSLRVLSGFYNDQGRLPVDQPEGQDGADRLLGPVIPIAPSESQPLPEYHAKRTRHPPVIDGDLKDAAWKSANPVTLVTSFDGHPASLRTVARVLYDDAYLYVAFDCEDPDVWGTLLKRDEPIYNEEVVEIFLDANADLKTYNELEVSPNNTVFDAYFPARRTGMDTSWDSQMKSAVKIRGTLNNPNDTDEGWSVEMAIPIARLAEVPHIPPRAGERWRFNLYRLEHLNHRTEVEGQAFSPLFLGDFHNLPRFGWLVFDGPGTP